MIPIEKTAQFCLGHVPVDILYIYQACELTRCVVYYYKRQLGFVPYSFAHYRNIGYFVIYRTGLCYGAGEIILEAFTGAVHNAEEFVSLVFIDEADGVVVESHKTKLRKEISWDRVALPGQGLCWCT